MEPERTPQEAPGTPVEAPDMPIEAPAAPLEASGTPIEPPGAPIEAPSAPIEAPSAPIEPPATPAAAPTQAQSAANSRRAAVRRELREWGKSLLIAIVAAVFITQVIIVNARVPTESMYDTIRVGDRVIGLRFSYWFAEPERYDIVIFKFPDNEKELYVKRLIGMPGETVRITAGEVYINGELTPLRSDFVTGPLEGDFGPYTVPEGHYFMMGDNRTNSWDSRYWTNTFLPDENVVAKAAVRLWPSPGKLE